MAKEAFYDDRIGAFYFGGGRGDQNGDAAALFDYRLGHIFRGKRFEGLVFKSIRESFRDGTTGIGVLVGDGLGEWLDMSFARQPDDLAAVNSRFPAINRAFEKTAKELGYKVVDLYA